MGWHPIVIHRIFTGYPQDTNRLLTYSQVIHIVIHRVIHIPVCIYSTVYSSTWNMLCYVYMSTPDRGYCRRDTIRYYRIAAHHTDRMLRPYTVTIVIA